MPTQNERCLWNKPWVVKFLEDFLGAQNVAVAVHHVGEPRNMEIHAHFDQPAMITHRQPSVQRGLAPGLGVQPSHPMEIYLSAHARLCAASLGAATFPAPAPFPCPLRSSVLVVLGSWRQSIARGKKQEPNYAERSSRSACTFPALLQCCSTAPSSVALPSDRTVVRIKSPPKRIQSFWPLFLRRIMADGSRASSCV